MSNDKKPTLTLRSKKQPAAPSQPETEKPYGETMREIVTQEWERAEHNKTIALEAAMNRITADDTLFRYLATIFIRSKCRRRIKRLNQTRTLTEQTTKIEQ